LIIIESKNKNQAERSELFLVSIPTGFAGAMNATFSSPSPAGGRRGAYRDVFTAWLEKVAFIAQTPKPCLMLNNITSQTHRISV
jgi:hypothetical protein